MIDAAEKAVSFASGRSRKDLDVDEMFSLALVKLVEIIGEAAKSVGEGTRAAHPDVAWAAAARMRDRLVHHYYDVNLDVLWSTVDEDLPSLLAILRAALPE